VCNGATVTYDYSITNNSDTFTWTGTFVDDVIGDIGGGAVVLAPNATSHFNDVPWVINGTVDNTVEGSGTFDDGSSSSASASASATVIGNICRIILQKITLPAGGGPFDFDGEFNQNLSDGDSVTHDKTSPDSYVTTENVPAGWDLTNRVCVDPNNNSTNTSADVAGGGTGSVTFNLQLGETITCTFTNTERGTVSITKTFEGGPIPAGESFDFQLRQGASTVSEGTVLDSVTVDSTTVFPLQLNGSLIPGEYQVCEYIQVGWDSTIRTMLGAFVPNSLSDPANTDNSFVCVPITIDPGEDETVVIDNTPPPGGLAKTIGFWKNHSSCKASNGGQEPVLDQTLALFPIADGESLPGFYIGLRYIDTCAEAYALLNKSLIEGSGGKGKGGTKAASDPAFNMAAQLVAVKLNLQAEAGAPNCLGSIVAEADALLVLVGFKGDAIPSYGNGATGAARKARMNYLAGLLDAYNNNNLNCASYVP
jgi:hypothetical protein